MIISKTPFRISFFGGGTDHPSWYQSNGGSVLSASINKYCYISCRPLNSFFEHNFRIVYSKIEAVNSISEIKHPAAKAVLDYFQLNKNLEIHHDADLPAKSGMGSSSAYIVGLINVLLKYKKLKMNNFEIGKLAIHIEQDVMKECVGSQDQIATALGGFNKIEFKRNNEIILSPFSEKNENIKYLENNLLLFYTKKQRIAGEIEKEKIKNFTNKSDEMNFLNQSVDHGIKILQKKEFNIKDFGNLLHQSWLRKKSLHTTVSNSVFDLAYDTAIANGAYGGKMLGAGGGGFVLFVVPKEKQNQVINCLKPYVNIKFKFENKGTKSYIINKI
jgi:D-glycero-alpha-D-manno-heptose-7-phosphate kinase